MKAQKIKYRDKHCDAIQGTESIWWNLPHVLPGQCNLACKANRDHGKELRHNDISWLKFRTSCVCGFQSHRPDKSWCDDYFLNNQLERRTKEILKNTAVEEKLN